jgi:hypothetical protein
MPVRKIAVLEHPLTDDSSMIPARHNVIRALVIDAWRLRVVFE